MKLLKTLVVTGVCLTMFCVGTAFAADGSGERQQKSDRKLSRLQDHLELSDEQVDSIAGKIREKREAADCKSHELFSERKQCREETKRDINSEIESVLTEEQRESFAELREKRKERKSRRGARRGA